MKKILTAIVAAFFAVPMLAQYNSGGFNLSESSVYYGIRLGANFSGIGGDEIDLGTKTGMNLAGVVGLRLSDSTPVFLESGLYYTERGAKKDKAKVGLTYLEIPILIKYGIQATNDIAVLPYIGPYFSYGFSGKIKNTVGGVSSSHTSYATGRYNHTDMGFKLGCGAEYNHLYLELGYQLGVANIFNNPDGSDITQHGHAFYVNFGVNF